MVAKPTVKPKRPWFSAGPTAKRPGWSSQGLPHDLLGRGIRAPEVVERFAHALRLTKVLLEVPEDWVLAYLPGSDTGAVEAAMWNMLGARPTQVMAFENFGKLWAVDARDHLKLPDLELLEAPWGLLPDLNRVDPTKDLVFPWNGTTAGVRVPNADFISKDREGIVICDATSAAFAMPIDYERVDVVTFSFQKALGGEAGIGIAALGPRAVARLDAYEPPRAVPKVLRLRDAKGFDRALATGTMINTFSLWTLEDWIDALEWADRIGGLKELIRRTDANAGALFDWVERTDWIEPLAVDPATRSTTSVCLKIVDPRVTALDEAGRQAFVKRMKTLLEAEGAAYDVESHRNAPAGLRLWCGCTVETEDVVAATPWLEWAFERAVAAL
ncbi:phosphoserine aminotransferase [Brevundimonas sp. AAP58]|uniref:phosphoserine transaminase n=1 Tax=Brevundimonas sp. AAP58 TaxID=1523422 RepID=UPI0006B97646|nr:phosphoserine transaminase [Brevundimonas sp. AAP58]KPF79508.1 phosphoserine aminotransferase [Brevundimonas sp. AAP58]